MWTAPYSCLRLQLTEVTVSKSYSCLWLQLAEVTVNVLHLSANLSSTSSPSFGFFHILRGVSCILTLGSATSPPQETDLVFLSLHPPPEATTAQAQARPAESKMRTYYNPYQKPPQEENYFCKFCRKQIPNYLQMISSS